MRLGVEVAHADRGGGGGGEPDLSVSHHAIVQLLCSILPYGPFHQYRQVALQPIHHLAEEQEASQAWQEEHEAAQPGDACQASC